MNAILETLSGTSLALHTALTTATGGFVSQAEAVKALNDNLLETETRLTNLKREQATNAFKDLTDLRTAQDKTAHARNAENAWKEYDAWSQTHNPNRGGFSQYATRQSISWGNSKEVKEYWKGIVQVLDERDKEIGNWIGVKTKDIVQWFENLGLSAQAGTRNAVDALDAAWQVYIDHLDAFAKGPQYEQMSSYFQGQMDRYFRGVVDSIDKETNITEAALTGYAIRIKAKQEEMYRFFSEDNDISGLLEQQQKMLPNLSLDDLDIYNAIIDQINGILEARNALAKDDIDKLDLLPIVTEDDLKRMQEANAEIIVLSGALVELFEKYRKAKEADEAKKSLYSDQIKSLKDAWIADETGGSFIRALNNIYAANEDLASAMVETHQELAKLASGEMGYTEGLEALTRMERLATAQSQERTEKLIKEAEAAKLLKKAQKEHYVTLLGQLQEAYQNTGYDAFVKLWDELGDTAKGDMIELYPEVAALATVMGVAAEGAVIFAEALAKAANMDYTLFGKALDEKRIIQLKSDQTAAAKEAGFKEQLQALSTALQADGLEGIKRALFEIYDANETLYQSLMDTYSVLYQLGQGDLNAAKAANVLSDAYMTQAVNSAKAAQTMREQIALEKELEAASKLYYKDTLERLQDAYRAEGTKGFHEVWERLDDTAKKFILEYYEAIGDLAAEAVERGTDVVDAIFEQAIENALAMKQKLLQETLAEDATEYVAKMPALEAGKSGFQDQLIMLRDALVNGDFIDALTSFGEEMTSALLAKHEWLNIIIESLTRAEDGTLSLTDATLLLNEHIQGTQAHFLASVETLIEANSKALDTEEAHIAMLETLMALLRQGNGVEAFAEAFSRLDDEMRRAIFDKSPALRQFFSGIQKGAADVGGAVRDMGRELDRLKLDKLAKEGKVFTGLADAMDNAAKGGKDFAKSYGAVLSNVESLNEAMGALSFIQSDQKKKASDVADAYSVLASYTGVSAEQLRNNLDPALWAIASDMDMASSSAAYLANWLFDAASVQFSAANWQAQLAALAASADATVANVARLVQTMLQAAGASLYLDGNTVKVKWGSAGNYTPPSARKTGGSGGGGASKEAEKTISAIEKLLDLMKQTMEIQDHRREMMRLAQEYHASRGEIQGVIAYLQKEQQIVRENSMTLSGYLSQLEREIEVKRREVAAMSTSAKEYEAAAKELEDLQKTHRDYSKELLKNATDVEKLTKAIKEQHDAIREMEINLRKTIHDAIRDREALNERMLQGTIDLENEIIAIVTKRYELERDEAIRTADLKRKALEEEMRLLDEQLAKRKALEDREDKLKKLKQLEEQVARISMDPTRQKEELALREQIAKLRRELAWDMAEDEVKAQKDALQKQINSIDDYLEYVKSYYEELMANPRKLIEEMAWLMQKTDEEIIAWLIANHADFADATDAMRTDMVNGWQSMLDDMRGHTRMFWDEVESIIAQGDDAIIAFLMEHSEDYRTAGRLQAQAYVDQWRQQLENLRNAYKQVAAEIQSYNYTVVQPSTYTGSSSSSGSGSGTSSAPKTQYKFVAAGKTYGPYATIAEAQAAKEKEVAKIKAGATSGSSMYAQAIAAIMQADIVKYAKGGLNTKTGLAWLDGTPQRPERVLSPYQTELFEDLISSLHEIRIKTPVMPVAPYQQAQAAQPFIIEQIVVNVEKLETDEDFEEMAEKVGQFIMSGMRQGTPVGGFRFP